MVFLDALQSGIPGKYQPCDVFQHVLQQDERALAGIVPDAWLSVNLGLQGRSGGIRRFLLTQRRCTPAAIGTVVPRSTRRAGRWSVGRQLCTASWCVEPV